ncbi:MAG: hypothetical protein QM729_07330 [Solirubrobacterales bacterium]
MPKAAVVRRFLEPTEWEDQPKRANHLRELDRRSGSIGWIGVNRPAQRSNLNFTGEFSSERYWGLDDLAMTEAVRELGSGQLESAFLMVPGLAALPLRDPHWHHALGRLLEAEGKVTDELPRQVVLLADRVKADWVAALDRGRVSVLVEVVPEGCDTRLVLPDVAIEVRGATGGRVLRPPWLWAEEWFPEAGDAEPDRYERLTLRAPISSRVHLTVDAGEPCPGRSSAELRPADERRVRGLNAAAAERAVRKVWAGRERDLRDALRGS